MLTQEVHNEALMYYSRGQITWELLLGVLKEEISLDEIGKEKLWN